MVDPVWSVEYSFRVEQLCGFVGAQGVGKLMCDCDFSVNHPLTLHTASFNVNVMMVWFLFSFLYLSFIGFCSSCIVHNDGIQQVSVKTEADTSYSLTAQGSEFLYKKKHGIQMIFFYHYIQTYN